MKLRPLFILSLVAASSCLISETAHSQVSFAGVAQMQTIKQKNQRYEADSTFPQFRTDTALTRYVNTKLRTEAKSNVATFAKDVSSVKEWGQLI